MLTISPAVSLQRLFIFEGLNSASSYVSSISCTSEQVPLSSQVGRALQWIIWLWMADMAEGTSHIYSSTICLLLSWGIKEGQMLLLSSGRNVPCIVVDIHSGNSFPHTVNRPVLGAGKDWYARASSKEMTFPNTPCSCFAEADMLMFTLLILI